MTIRSAIIVLLWVAAIAHANRCFARPDVALAPTAAGTRWYVDRAASPLLQDGLSWQTPFTSLHTALSAAQSGDEIWVAGGFSQLTAYKPSAVNDRSESFTIDVAVSIHGGFLGASGGGGPMGAGETALDQRGASRTILSGNLGIGAQHSDDSYHVIEVLGAAPVVLDQFTIERGNANDNGPPDDSGGGARIESSTVSFFNCGFISNRAEFGGAVAADSSTLSFADCTVSIAPANNIVPTNRGGGIYAIESAISCTNCSFNRADPLQPVAESGGAIYSQNPPANGFSLETCAFFFIESSGDGGAIALHNPQSAEIVNSAFDICVSDANGGAVLLDGGSLRLEQVQIEDCVAGFDGGGICVRNGSSLVWALGSASRNSAGRHGGLIDAVDSSVSISGKEFSPFPVSMCTSSVRGGVVSLEQASLALASVHFQSNSTLGSGGVVFATGGAAVLNIDGCEFVDNSVVPSGVGGALALELGTLATLESSTFEANRAVSGGAIHARDADTSLTIDTCELFGNSATSLGGAIVCLDAAQLQILHSVLTENTCLLEAGALFIRATPTDLTNVHFMENWSGTIGGGISIVDAAVNIGTSTFNLNEATSGGAIHVSGAAASLGITGGAFSENSATDLSDGQGGAVRCVSGALASVSNVMFAANAATGKGGALYSDANLFAVNSSFVLNHATEGGAIQTQSVTGAVSYEGCVFSENSATSAGGASLHRGRLSLVRSSIFDDNTAPNGAAILIAQPNQSPRIENSLIAFNNATAPGGAIEFTQGSVARPITVLNTTITENNGVGVRIASPGASTTRAIIQNSIVWDGIGASVLADAAALVSVTYSTVEGGFSGSGNLDEDPKFVSPLGGDAQPSTGDEDFALGIGSQCIDAGNSNLVPVPMTMDLAGNPRILDAVQYIDTGVPDLLARVVDMGAYESPSNTPAAGCAGDADGSNSVDVNDITFVVFRLGDSGPPGTVPGDMDGNGFVDVNDITFVVFRLGTVCK